MFTVQRSVSLLGNLQVSAVLESHAVVEHTSWDAVVQITNLWHSDSFNLVPGLFSLGRSRPRTSCVRKTHMNTERKMKTPGNVPPSFSRDTGMTQWAFPLRSTLPHLHLLYVSTCQTTETHFWFVSLNKHTQRFTTMTCRVYNCCCFRRCYFCY